MINLVTFNSNCSDSNQLEVNGYIWQFNHFAHTLATMALKKCVIYDVCDLHYVLWSLYNGLLGSLKKAIWCNYELALLNCF